MRSRRGNQLAAVVLALTVTLLVAIPIGVQAQEQGADPSAVVAAAQAARSGSDAAAAAAFFTDNAIWVRTVATGACSRQSPCIGRPAILAQFQVEAAIHQCVTVVDQTATGGVVVSHFEVRSDTLRRNGIERTLTESMALVDQGKIVAQYNFSDLSDEETAANAAIGAGAQAPGAPIPNPATSCG
jgi:hypothetical protein